MCNELWLLSASSQKNDQLFQGAKIVSAEINGAHACTFNALARLKRKGVTGLQRFGLKRKFFTNIKVIDDRVEGHQANFAQNQTAMKILIPTPQTRGR
jgi:hypothetical protein